MKNTLGCVTDFARPGFRPDMAKIVVPTLVIHDGKEQIVPFETTGRLSDWQLNTEGKRKAIGVQGAVISNNGQVLADAAIAGLGLILLPEFIVGSALEQSKLASVLDRYHPASLSLSDGLSSSPATQRNHPRFAGFSERKSPYRQGMTSPDDLKRDRKISEI